MLVLSRKRGESIIIGGNIVVQVMELRGDKVRIGIQADPDITVNRKEVQDAIDNGQNRRKSAEHEGTDNAV